MCSLISGLPIYCSLIGKHYKTKHTQLDFLHKLSTIQRHAHKHYIFTRPLKRLYGFTCTRTEGMALGFQLGKNTLTPKIQLLHLGRIIISIGTSNFY